MSEYSTLEEIETVKLSEDDIERDNKLNRLRNDLKFQQTVLKRMRISNPANGDISYQEYICSFIEEEIKKYERG